MWACCSLTSTTSRIPLSHDHHSSDTSRIATDLDGSFHRKILVLFSRDGMLAHRGRESDGGNTKRAAPPRRRRIFVARRQGTSLLQSPVLLYHQRTSGACDA